MRNGTANTTIIFGSSTDLPVARDWNDDDSWDVGVFRNLTKSFNLKNGTCNKTVNFGLSMGFLHTNFLNTPFVL